MFDRSLIVTLLAACLTCIASPSATADTLRVMTFNIRGATYGIDPVDAWIWLNIADPPHVFDGPHRRDRALNVIQSYGPDILGVQELKLMQREDILARFPNFAFFGQGRQGGLNDDANGFFYRQDRFRLLEGGDFWLSTTPNIPGTTFVGNGTDTGNPRMATWAIFRDFQTGQRFFALNTHWSLDSQARNLSAALIQSYLPTLSQDLPILLLGDLNTTDGTTAYRTLAGQFSGANIDLLDGFEDGGGVDGRTYHAYGGGISGSRIDHVLYTPDLFTPTSTNIIRTTFDGGLYPSDHYPVTVDFTIAVPEASAMILLGAGSFAILMSLRLGRTNPRRINSAQ